VIGAIVPAAGMSRRMGNGVQKLVLPLAGKPVVAHVVDSLLEALDSSRRPIVVVTRAGDEKIAPALTGRNVSFVVNPQIDGDMLSSIRAGLRALPLECTGILVAPADFPRVTAAIVRRLVAAFTTAPDRIVVPLHNSRRGHPILFPSSMRNEVLSKFDGDGLRGLLQAYPEAVLEVPVSSSGVIEDIDQPIDYERAAGGMTIPSSGTPGEG
jgi:molybdenum cofactor cytidylyltransferase